MEASFKAAKELHSEVSATNANFKKVYESLTNFTNNVASLALAVLDCFRLRCFGGQVASARN